MLCFRHRRSFLGADMMSHLEADIAISRTHVMRRTSSFARPSTDVAYGALPELLGSSFLTSRCTPAQLADLVGRAKAPAPKEAKDAASRKMSAA
eukprot:2933435-Rhodomonas_salina.2